MAERDDQSNLPPIPDGGLSESMPDWLRRPPAWRTLPDREVAAPEPAETSALPEPDDSVIDPRTFLSDDDLPEWLRKLGPGHRAGSASGQDAPAIPAREPQPETRALSPQRAMEGIATARFVPTTPPVAGSPATRSRVAPESALRTPPRSQSAPGSEVRGERTVAILATLLVVAIVVIVALLIG